MKVVFKIILTLLGIVLFQVGTLDVARAAQQVDAEAVLSFADFQGEEEDSAHFYQNYSLMWRRSALIGSSRFGAYSLGLGYSWAALNTNQNVSNDTRLELDKFLYNAKIELAPGGLPFHLVAYVRDEKRPQPVEGRFSNLRFGDGDNQPLFDQVYADLNDGTHVSSGLTLVVGESAGRYTGAWRDVMAASPMLMIDYSDVEVDDTETFTPMHYRDRNLAYVSLNKRDNWLHYTFTQHTDYLNSKNDSRSYSVLLGTVDHADRRRFINLTNWIKLSTDLSYREYTPVVAGILDKTRQYNGNMFLLGHLKGLTADLFSNYERSFEKDNIETELHLPFYVTYRSRGYELSGALLGDYERSQYVGTGNGLDFKSDNSYGKFSYKNRKAVRFSSQTSVELERLDTDGLRSEGEAVRLTYELGSSPLRRKQDSFLFQYSASYFSGESSDVEEVDYNEHTLDYSWQRRRARGFSYGFSEKLLYGEGSYDNSITQHLAAEGAIPIAQQGGLTTDLGGYVEGRLFRSRTDVFLDHVDGYFKNHVEVGYDYIERDDSGNGVVALRYQFDYNKRDIWIKWFNEYLNGDQRDYASTIDSSGLFVQNAGDTFDQSMLSRFNLRYFLARNTKVSGRLSYTARWKTSDVYGVLEAKERVEHTFMRPWGRDSRLVLAQTAEMEMRDDVGDESKAYAFTLESDYVATKAIAFAAQWRYQQRYLPVKEATWVFRFANTYSFKRLQLSLDYAYGTQDADDSDGITEQRWGVEVRKTF